MDFDWDMMKNVFFHILLFLLIFGFGMTVSVLNLKIQMKNRVALATGVFLRSNALPWLSDRQNSGFGFSSRTHIACIDQ
jgi:hypothetical protein